MLKESQFFLQIHKYKQLFVWIVNMKVIWQKWEAAAFFIIIHLSDFFLHLHLKVWNLVKGWQGSQAPPTPLLAKCIPAATFGVHVIVWCTLVSMVYVHWWHWCTWYSDVICMVHWCVVCCPSVLKCHLQNDFSGSSVLIDFYWPLCCNVLNAYFHLEL